MPPGAVTQLLNAHRGGNREAVDQLVPIVYDELRRLAASYLRAEREDHTLQPTALVHEAYVRLIGQDQVEWQSRAHFFGVSANIMRRLLVDHARGHGRKKRAGDQVRVPIDDVDVAAPEQGGDLDLVLLDDALERLALLSPQQSRIVELRYFGGLSIEETAEVLGVSGMTVKRGWAMARAWLHRELAGRAP